MPTPQSPQLLDPHKFDVADKTPSTGTDAELRALVIDMLKQGHSEEEVRRFVQKADDLKDPTSARMAGAMAGIGPGLLTGLIGVPLMVKDAVLDGLSMLQGRDPENAKAFVDSVKTFLPKLRDADPREQAQMVSELVTSFGAGAAMGGGAFAARKPIAKATGAGLLKAVEHPAGVRLTSGSALLGGIYTGNPGMIAAGAAGAALPDVAEGTGRALYKYGAGREYVSPTQVKAVSKLEDKFKDAMATRNGTFYDEQAAAAGEAKKAALVAAAKEGLEPGTPSVRTSLSAKDANGGRTSVSQSFKTPSAASLLPVPEGLSAAEEAAFREIKSLNVQVPDAAIVAGIRGTKVAPIANVTPAGRPAIRVTGGAMGTGNPLPTPENYMNGEVLNIGKTAKEMGDRTVQGLRDQGHTVPQGGFQSTSDIDAFLHTPKKPVAPRPVGPKPKAWEPPAPEMDVVPEELAVSEVPSGAAVDDLTSELESRLKDIPSSKSKTGSVAVEDAPSPRNLHMGSGASPRELAADVRVRAQGGGGIRIDGSRPGKPISLVKGEPLPLTEEAANVLKQYLTENPEVDPAVAEAHLRKLMGPEE